MSRETNWNVLSTPQIFLTLMEIHFVSGCSPEQRKLLTRCFTTQCVPFPRAAQRPELPVELVEVLTLTNKLTLANWKTCPNRFSPRYHELSDKEILDHLLHKQRWARSKFKIKWLIIVRYDKRLKPPSEGSLRVRLLSINCSLSYIFNLPLCLFASFSHLYLSSLPLASKIDPFTLLQYLLQYHPS